MGRGMATVTEWLQSRMARSRDDYGHGMITVTGWLGRGMVTGRIRAGSSYRVKLQGQATGSSYTVTKGISGISIAGTFIAGTSIDADDADDVTQPDRLVLALIYFLIY